MPKSITSQYTKPLKKDLTASEALEISATCHDRHTCFKSIIATRTSRLGELQRTEGWRARKKMSNERERCWAGKADERTVSRVGAETSSILIMSSRGLS